MSPYRVQAHNTAVASENKIHDDTVARQFGFTGGLVPGVEVYAYMTHMPVALWGRDWLARGSAECRFAKPIYDGESATVTSVDASDRLEISVESRGEICASGHASAHHDAAAPLLGAFEPVSPPAVRPPADEQTLATGSWLGIAPLHLTADYAARYLHDVRETDPLYAAEGIAHPGILLRLCNWALTHNVVLGPWIHVGSHVRNFALARVGDELGARACVAANYERKGHRFVDLDVLVIANGTAPLARVIHTAIYRPRQAAGAA